jgi:hypothetical protein
MERLPRSRVTVILTGALAAVYMMHLSEAENSIMSALVLALANNAEYFAACLSAPETGRDERLPAPEDGGTAPLRQEIS